ncbi:MAG: hypothetical protein L0Z50_28350, partial [Verrucomicrobiales bacterium]|nr:hypothetical protein [Verrucomicrobiales bacterium]
MTQPKQKLGHSIIAGTVSAILVSVSSPLRAVPLITNVVESNGDDEATDTISAKWTGVTFQNGVANEPVAGKAADADYTVGFFQEETPMFVDRNHQWNGATTALPLPKYLVGGEYIMSGNDNRDNAEYKLEITIAEESYVYMLVDDRLGEASNGNPPNFPDWMGDRTGDGNPDMAWLLEQGWTPVKSGLNRFGNPDYPDHVGADEGGDGVGPGVAINQWSSIYVKRIPAGTFSILQADNNGQNMYGVVIKAVPKTPSVTRATGDLFGLKFEITDGAQTVLEPNSITLTLDGSAITPQVSKTADVTKIDYTAPALLAPASAHTAELKFADRGTPPGNFSETLNFTVESYGTLTPEMKITADTSKPGFIWRVFANAGNQENTTDKSERTVLGELRGADGTLLPNLADPAAQGVALGTATAPSPANGFITFEIGEVINLSQTAGESNGNFPEDGQMPGIPGTDGGIDGIVGEITTYLDLPAGLITMGVNSDDGFVTYAGRVNDATSRVRLGEFSGGRGASDTIFRFVVQQAGVYPFRTLWEEGNGGANIEWFTLKEDRTKVLLNDLAKSGVKGYRAATTPAEPFVRKARPGPGATGVAADTSIEIEIVDTTIQVDQNSVGLKVDGTATTPTISKTAGTTTVILANSALYAANSDHAIELTYKAGADTITRTWTFKIANYPTLSSGLASSVGSGKDSGFRIRTVQSEAGRPNSGAAAEQQLLNNSGAPNIADLSGAGADGFFVHT